MLEKSSLSHRGSLADSAAQHPQNECVGGHVHLSFPRAAELVPMRYNSHAIAEDSHNSSSTGESIVIDSYRAVVGTQIQLTPCWTKVGNETLSLDESCVVFCPWTRAL